MSPLQVLTLGGLFIIVGGLFVLVVLLFPDGLVGIIRSLKTLLRSRETGAGKAAVAEGKR